MVDIIFKMVDHPHVAVRLVPVAVRLTLTAASTVIVLDRPWTLGDVHQAEDRLGRIGQTMPVTSNLDVSFRIG
jgi:hypothetical protein